MPRTRHLCTAIARLGISCRSPILLKIRLGRCLMLHSRYIQNYRAQVLVRAARRQPGAPAGVPDAASAETAPNHTTDAPEDSFTPAMPPAARPCGRTEEAP